jgi:hypothetical protein
MFAAFYAPSTFNARFADLFIIHLRTNVTTSHQKSKPKHEFHVVIVVHITATMLKPLNKCSKFFGQLLTTQNVTALHTAQLVSLVLLKSVGPLFYTTEKFPKYNNREDGTRHVNLTLISLQNKVPALIHLPILCV